MKLTSTVVAAALAATSIVSAAPIPGEGQSKPAHGTTSGSSDTKSMFRGIGDILQELEGPHPSKQHGRLSDEEQTKAMERDPGFGRMNELLEQRRAQLLKQANDKLPLEPRTPEKLKGVQPHALQDAGRAQGRIPTFKSQMQDGLPGSSSAAELDLKSVSDVSHAGGSADGVLAAAEGSLHGLRI